MFSVANDKSKTQRQYESRLLTVQKIGEGIGGDIGLAFSLFVNKEYCYRGKMTMQLGVLPFCFSCLWFYSP